MKKATAILAVLATAIVSAQTKDEVLVCDGIDELARVVMNSRQNGIPLKMMMDVFSDTEFTKEQHRLFQKMLTEAYEKPRFSTESIKQETITEYGNKWYLVCLNSFKAKS